MPTSTRTTEGELTAAQANALAILREWGKLTCSMWRYNGSLQRAGIQRSTMHTLVAAGLARVELRGSDLSAYQVWEVNPK